ncbi:MAG: hypothetical protein PHY71_04785 [Bacteroidaceae bacterium]|nr:hypothetical protein [Bacteroidaceae bacterium]
MSKAISQNVKIIGEITATFRVQDNELLKKYNSFLEKLYSIGAISKKTLYKLRANGRIVKQDFKKNVICNAGFNAITKLLTGDTTYTGEINKALLGTGVGSASASDTTLITEAYRNDIASGTDSANIAYLTAFFTEVEVSGTFTEFGNCIDGTGDPDTGQLWSHLAGLNWVKDSVTSLTIDCKYTFQSI